MISLRHVGIIYPLIAYHKENPLCTSKNAVGEIGRTYIALHALETLGIGVSNERADVRKITRYL